MHHPTDRITHTTAFVTPVVEHWLEQELAQWVCLVKGVAHMCESVQLANKILYQVVGIYCRRFLLLLNSQSGHLIQEAV